MASGGSVQVWPVQHLHARLLARPPSRSQLLRLHSTQTQLKKLPGLRYRPTIQYTAMEYMVVSACQHEGGSTFVLEGGWGRGAPAATQQRWPPHWCCSMLGRTTLLCS